MSERPSTETLTEPSNTGRASKRVKLDNSPPVKHHLRDEAPALGSSASVAPTRNRKQAASEGPVEAPGGCSPFPSTSKRQRLDDDLRQHNLDRGTVSAAAAGNPPIWNRTCEAIARAMENAMRLSEQDETINDALFGYEIVDTTEEGLRPYGTADRIFEQLNFKKLQFDAIRLLIHPERRQHPEIGLCGSVRTPVRYWAKRLEANRLIRLGLPPWHLENWGEVCGFRVPGRYIRPPRGHPPVIPLEYCETHISTLAELLKGRESGENQRTQSDIVEQLLRDIKWVKAMKAARDEYLGVEDKLKAAKPTEGGNPQAADKLPTVVQPALEQAGEHEDNRVEGSSPETTIMPSSPWQPPTPEPINHHQQQQQQQQQQQKKTKKTRKTTPSHHMTRRSARRASVDETWELDSRGRKRIAKRG